MQHYTQLHFCHVFGAVGLSKLYKAVIAGRGSFVLCVMTVLMMLVLIKDLKE
jgi:hypothetical protein